MLWRLKRRWLRTPAWVWLSVGAAALSLRLIPSDLIWRYLPSVVRTSVSRTTQYVLLGRTPSGEFYDIKGKPSERTTVGVATFFDELKIGPMWPPPGEGVWQQFRGRVRWIGLVTFAGEESEVPPLFEPMWVADRYHLGIQWASDGMRPPSEQPWQVTPQQIEPLVEIAARRSETALPEGGLASLSKGPFDVRGAPSVFWMGAAPLQGLWSSEWRWRFVPRAIARNLGLVFGTASMLIGAVLVLYPQGLMRIVRRGRGCCPTCKYDLKFQFDKVCPECGKDPKTNL